ncbi:Cytochrome p450 [Thalictrum thalictroides]|uniref:Cytochrome p450 n=1 Tax=Thalictrum thalictroides TaxID=46969 RepID=A0A7J6X348_THATH|nr:Cytochrome p450 [Thalictrum thalictroides]
MIQGIMIAWPWHLVLWSGICLVVLVAIHLLTKHRHISKKLPPGPPGWPIIGNIFDLDSAAHDTLERLSQKYGPVFWLRLGAVNTMVVSSAEAATEMFKNHDITFAGRTTNEALRVNSYDKGSMALSQYGSYWRMLRRICTTELFTNNRINGTQSLRTKCVDIMMKWMWDEAQDKGSVEVARFLGLMSFNISSNVMLSKDLVDPQSKQGAEFFESINQAMELCAKLNIADFFPFLRWLDPQGIKRMTEQALVSTHKFAYSFVEERILERQNGKKSARKDFLDVMLDFEGDNKDGEPARISEKNIGFLIFAVVKETLRLHPPVPLLIPRRAMKDTEFMGYSIPENTQILVNVWAIGRDSASWEDPLSFKPESTFEVANGILT